MSQSLFPARDPAKLEELKAVIDLLISISSFRHNVLKQTCVQTAASVVRECIQANVATTYRDLFERCSSNWAAARESAASVQTGTGIVFDPPPVDSSITSGSTGTQFSNRTATSFETTGEQLVELLPEVVPLSTGQFTALRAIANLDFWQEVAKFVIEVIEEDTNIYSDAINQYDRNLE